jgi:hypothetical protein
MENLDQRISEWREAKLLTEKQATAIAAFEASRTPAPGARVAAREDGTGMLLAEAIGYVGAAIAVAAIVTLLASGNRWDGLNLGDRLGLVGLLTLIVSGAGLALRASGRSPIRRLVSLLLSSGVLGVAWMVGILANDQLRWESSSVVLAVGIAALVPAVIVYRWRNRALPQLVILASLLVIVGAVLGRPGVDATGAWIGLSMWAVGAAWALLGLGRWLAPDRVAVGLGSVVALVSAQIGSLDRERLALLAVGLVTAALLMARGVAKATTYLVTIGAVGVLVFLPQAVVELFGATVGALATMLVVGLLLVLASVRLARGRSAKAGGKGQ